MNRSKSKTLPLLTSVLLTPVTMGGYVYSFGFYANDLKESLQLSQAHVTTLSSAMFCAGALQFLPGMIVDRYGERSSFLLGSITGSTSLQLYWCIATKRINLVLDHDTDTTTTGTSTSDNSGMVSVLCALALVTFLSNSLLCGAAFKVMSKICHQSKGVIVGIAKGYIGLAAGIVATLFRSLHRESTLDILPLLAIFFIVTGGVLPYFLVPATIPVNDIDPLSSSKGRIYLLYTSLVLCSILVVGQSLSSLGAASDKEDANVADGVDYFQFFTIMIAWIGPIVGTFYVKEGETNQPAIDYSTLPVNDKGDELIPFDEDEETNAKSSFTLPQMLQTLPAWLLVWTLTMLAGAGVTVNQNLGHLVLSLELHDKTVTPAALALFSAGSCLARVVVGTVASTRSRSKLLLLSTIATTVAHVCLASSHRTFDFLVSICLTGIAYGSYHPLLILLVGDVFGPKYLASNFLFMDGFCLASGSLVINKLISQHVYLSHQSEGSITCIGRGCFGATHWITAALCATSFVSCFSFGRMISRKEYSNDLEQEKMAQ